MRSAFSIFALLMFLTASALANEPVKKEPAPAQESAKSEAAKEKPAVLKNPYLEKVDAKAKELAAALSEEESRNVGMVRQSFGVLRSIGVVRRNVDNAVKLCAKANPDMKKPLQERFDTWEGEVAKHLKAQEKNLKKAVSKDHFKQPGEVQEYLDLLDNAAGYAEEKMSKEVVTTPEACTHLQKSMDQTQKVLTDLLGELPWPQVAAAAPAEDLKKGTP